MERGHRRIAPADRETPTAARLRAGYEAALAAFGPEPATALPPVGAEGSAAGRGGAMDAASGARTGPGSGPGRLSVAHRLARTLDRLCAAVTTGGVTTRWPGRPAYRCPRGACGVRGARGRRTCCWTGRPGTRARTGTWNLLPRLNVRA
ncbi:hypothetical protein [Streptomyces sp. NBC_01276]|uniref:hypothetical protein n=1 Tax=Streptomyces sp. NBC_01276 TaxID=2903808 RepID=UPI00352F2CF6